MATQTKLQVIDADAHVIETERTWDYLEPCGAEVPACAAAQPL